MPDRLKNKVAVVVGAGSIGPGWGNGKATAVAFAREGARVLCVDVNIDAAQETAGIIAGEGGQARAFRADVTKAADIAAMVEAATAAYGRIDVLDNNVGIAQLGGVVEISEADWDRVFAVNLKGAFLAMKHVIPLMAAQGGGSIINISSIAAIRYTGLPYATYYASKAALSHLTRTTAVEYAGKRVRVNAILPGLMQTPASPAPTAPPTSTPCGRRAPARCPWASAARPGTSPGPPSISPATRAATSPASSWWSTAAPR